MTPARFRKPKDGGSVLVRIRTPSGIQWISTGQSTIAMAREVYEASNIRKLELASAANALTTEVIARLTTGTSVTFEQAFERWKLEVTPRFSASTAADYVFRLQKCFRELRCLEKPISFTSQLNLGLWMNVGTYATRQKKLNALKSFYHFLQNGGLYTGNPAELLFIDVRNMLMKDRMPKITVPMTRQEVDILLASPKTPPFWRVAIVVAYWTALRLKDIAYLQWASLLPDGFIIYQQKTGAPLKMSFSDPMLDSEELRTALWNIPPNDSDFCFPEEREVAGDPARRATHSTYFGLLLKRHGIFGKHFHALRHTCALRFKAAGRTPLEVSHILGHSSPQTTETYLNHPAENCG